MSKFNALIITHSGRDMVDGRAFFDTLRLSQHFSTWVKQKIARFDLRRGVDYEDFEFYRCGRGRSPREYVFEPSAALRIASMERNGAEVTKFLQSYDPSLKIENEYASIATKQAAARGMGRASVFHFQHMNVRVMTDEEGELHFVAKDVAEALDYKWNGTDCIRHVPEEWRRVRSVLTLRGDFQEMATLTEQGLYFFLGRSDKPKALPFQKWIAGEVLPSIRKTGSYAIPGQPPGRHDRAYPNTTLTQAAQSLNIRLKHLTLHMHQNDWIYRDERGAWAPYREKRAHGLLELTPMGCHVVITPEGLRRLSEELGGRKGVMKR